MSTGRGTDSAGGSSGSPAPIAVSGVYAFREPPGDGGCADEPAPPRPFYLLRFYEEGVVVAAIVLTDDAERDWSQIGTWLTEQHGDRGAYRLTGDVISFTITSSSGSVDYFGVVRPQAMTLSWRSKITGSIRNAIEYVRLEIEAEEPRGV